MANSPIIRYKQKLMSSIINSPDLIRLIDPTYVDESNECIGVDEGLVYKKIFPFYYITETQTDTSAYVIIKVNEIGRLNSLYNSAEVFICVISHQDIMKVDGGNGTRIDMMGEAVEDLFDGRDDFGFGAMELKSNIETNIDKTFRCREIHFVVEDFNRNACTEE